MAIKIVCPNCYKTVEADQNTPKCSRCGETFKFTELKAQNMIVNAAVEKREIEIAKDYFSNTEFLNAANHFKLALNANKNSYQAQYFAELCDIYLSDGDDKFDLIGRAVSAVNSTVEMMARSGASQKDKRLFVPAMLSDIKILINSRLLSDDELFSSDPKAYRIRKLDELDRLQTLFETGENLVASMPEASVALLEIADNAIAVIYKAVQTSVIGGELFPPSSEEYVGLFTLYKKYCKFAISVKSDYDIKKYTPDFEPNELLIEKVISRFEKYDEKNKADIKKHVINDVKSYIDILNECGKAITLTYYNCFMSLCDIEYEKRRIVMKSAIPLLCRMLLPRVTPISGKNAVDIKTDAQDDVKGKCAILNEFIKEIDSFDPEFAQRALHEYYSDLLEIMDIHFVPEYAKRGKTVNKLKEVRDGNFKFYERLLFAAACSCTPAIESYVKFNKYKIKPRVKLVKYCNQAVEEFLLLHDCNIGEIEHSKQYSPILDICKELLNSKE